MDYLSCFYLVTAMGSFTLAGVFLKMKEGFGPYNIRAIGIVLVSIFVTLLAVKSDSSLTDSIGILGAIIGYLFSIKKDT